jgi:dihydroneopterin aldolase/2-amino-4-hydroxy-6-hydroxymethyldihydropteridine diphosphokinase
MKMDQIKINGLQVYANHGVLKEENVLGQKFIISAIIYTDVKEAGTADDLTKSIHYGEVSHEIQRFLKAHTYQLIETIAEQLSRHLLLTYPLMQEITLEIEKPWAPIGLPLETVSIKINRKWHISYISLGSNMGDKEKYLRDAIIQLEARAENQVLKVSKLLVTEPYGVVEQDEFLNGCLKLRTLMSPRELLNCIHEIEKMAKRERTLRWGPRTLDLDIIFYDDLVMEEEDLVIPHKEMHLRDFVLNPLEEIAPRAIHPIYGKTVEQLRSKDD